ncbi:terpenoid synthase [Aspergillus steynii IBT 23096]|uniref:Terpene synthase n=1 Tax=Aspergillus steynii IBT 23096 TaxID=1392250 RepID=A0A2I2GFL5_9EURO|nr:terpenoid synthase [Aspergillus steynii IBT 23096]PLB51669.1 terpenoid synthase [Aspergillus steynii IBT 23096]
MTSLRIADADISDCSEELTREPSLIERDRQLMPTLTQDHPPASLFVPDIHPNVIAVSTEVNEYFLQRWPFRNDAERAKFRAAGFSRMTCLYFPRALQDRIPFACRLVTLLFLVDDLLEEISLQEGSEYNERLIAISRGDISPDRTVPVQAITHEVWEDMRACDKVLADDLLEHVSIFMRAQTEKARLTICELGKYLNYRERDVGQGLLSALLRFTMKLHLSDTERRQAAPIERNCAKHIAILNDIYSWRKEQLASQNIHQEGAAVCSAVQVLSNEATLGFAAAQRVLWAMCREYELVYRQLVQEATPGSSDSLHKYLRGLEYQMSGNERWSESTPRYHG